MAPQGIGNPDSMGRNPLFMLNSISAGLLVGTVLGFLSGLGVGGGSLLMLWLTLVIGYPIEEARTINLLFFLPAAAISCLFRWKQGALHWKKVFPAILSGCITAFLCARLSDRIHAEYLQKAFGILLLITGIRELRYKKRSAE